MEFSIPFVIPIQSHSATLARVNHDFIPYLPWLGGLLGLLCLWAALRSARKQRLIDDLPTSKTTGVFIGLVELKGTAESEQPFTSFLAEQPCVYYSWSVQEQWSRTVTETYTDNDGRAQTRTRTESGWTTVAEGGESQLFYLQDDCGVILLRPEGAKLETQTIFSETCTPLNALYYGKGPSGAVMNSDLIRRFTEEAIVLHAPLYVIGQARERQDIVAPEIAADKSAPLFLISTRSEKEVSSSYGWGEWGWGFFGLILSLAGIFLFEKQNLSGENWIIVALVGVGYLMIAALGWVWMVYNSVVDLRQRVRQAWSQVDVQLKRRHDLIPNLVQTIQGLRDYEKNLQTELAGLRTELTATGPGQPGPDFHSCARTLIAVAERYPELKTQESFLNLQNNLSDTEQRIALARGYFNDIATYYNTRLEIVPDRFVAGLLAMKPEALMTVDGFERAPVEVSLA